MSAGKKAGGRSPGTATRGAAAKKTVGRSGSKGAAARRKASARKTGKTSGTRAKGSSAGGGSKTSAVRKATAKAAGGKKTTAGKSGTKKTAAGKSGTKKTAAKKTTAKKTRGKKTVNKKTAAKKTTAKKTGARKSAPTKTTARNPATSKTAAPKARPRRARGPKLTKQMLTGIRARLTQDLADLEKQLEELREEASSESEDSGLNEDFADAGTSTFDRERDLSIRYNVEDLIDQVRRALARIDEGKYGVCENCGNPIDAARLKAFPRMLMCLDCKRRDERAR